MKRLSLLLVLLCGSATQAWGAYAVCFDATRAAGSRFYAHESIDATQLTDPNCTVLAKGSVTPEVLQAQRTLVRTTPWKYLTVTGGLAVELSPAEKTAVDAELAAPTQARQPFVDEVEASGVCKFTTFAELETALTNRLNARQALLDQAETNVETAIAAYTPGTVTAANIRTLMTQLKTIQFNVHDGLLQEIFTGVRQALRCDLARFKMGR